MLSSVPRVIKSTCTVAPQRGGVLTRGVTTRGRYNGIILLANECTQTRPEDTGCDNDGVCTSGITGLLMSQNRPRSDCRGCDNKGGGVTGSVPTSEFVKVVASDSRAAAGVVRA